jgi:hypothetical protein
MPLGYRGNADWRDMSEYAVHFTKDSMTLDAYSVMLTILWEGSLRPGPASYGAARNLGNDLGDSQRSACFSEIPLDMLERLIDRRSLYGIGFSQRFLVRNGGARVWYLDNDGAAADVFTEIIREAMVGGMNPDDGLWALTPFVDYPGTYPDGKEYRFEWEREWRVPGGLQFGPDDVVFLFIPEDLHAPARNFFEEHERDHSGPAYLCPYIDPRWDISQIQAALGSLPTP